MHDLTVISNKAGFGGPDLTSWIEARMVRRVICSYPRTSPAYIAQSKASQIEIEVVPRARLPNASASPSEKPVVPSRSP